MEELRASLQELHAMAAGGLLCEEEAGLLRAELVQTFRLGASLAAVHV